MFSETDNSIIIFYVAGTSFVFLLIVSLIFYVYLHQLRVNRFRLELREKELKTQQEVFFALSDGEEKERKRLAAELHDGVGARLSGMRMKLEYLLESRQDKEEAMLNQMVSGMDEVIAELREISHNLQPSFLMARGLHHALKDLIGQCNAGNETKIGLYMDEGIRFPDSRIELIVYRIVSELVVNIVKHAGAKNASVQIVGDDGKLRVTVEDDGKGFGQRVAQPGIGLINLKERISALNGLINIDSSERGTVVIVELPAEKTFN